MTEDTQEFVERLKNWRDDPGSEPQFEKWYTDVYLGHIAQQPPSSQAGVTVPSPAQILQPPKKQTSQRVPMTKAEWQKSLANLVGKEGVELDTAASEMIRKFRSAFDAELEFEDELIKALAKRRGGGKLRSAVAELGVALNRLPIDATRDNPSFKVLRLGDDLEGSYGDFNPFTGTIRIDVWTFTSRPMMERNRVSHAYETLIHEIGHAVHCANEGHFTPWMNTMWDLDPLRKTAGLWDLKHYMRAPGVPKDTDGMTPYGRKDPLEDFADTWRILYVERNGPSLTTHTATSEGRRIVYGDPHPRFAILRELILQLGWKVPTL